MKIGILGTGSWGTALALFLAGKGIHVTIAGRSKKRNREIQKAQENIYHFQGFSFPENLNVAPSFQEMGDCNLYIFAIPTTFLRNLLTEKTISFRKEALFLSVIKGIEHNTLHFPSGVIKELVPSVSEENLAVLSGPNFAHEVAMEQPTATTIASKNPDILKELTTLFSSHFFRSYGNNDVIGVELAGALKNIYAIAVGISDGMKKGNNARAALMTRSMAEMMRLGKKMGAQTETFLGLSGYGDLILTCTGELSRNRKVGIFLGEGHDFQHYLKEKGVVAEGIHTAQSVMKLMEQYQVEMPIAQEIYRILYEKKHVKDSLTALLNREPKNEFY